MSPTIQPSQPHTKALKSNSDTISTLCPLCMTMMTAGVKAKGKEEWIQVKDFAKILADTDFF